MTLARGVIPVLISCTAIANGVAAAARGPVGKAWPSLLVEIVTPTRPQHLQFLTSPNQGTPQEIASKYIQDHKEEFGLAAADLIDVIVASEVVSEHTGVTHLYLRQRYHGIEVWGADISANITKDGRIISMDSSFVPNLAAAVSRQSPAQRPANAVESAAKQLGLTMTKPLSVVEARGGPAQETKLSGGGIAMDGIPVRLVYQPVGSGKVRLAWHIEIQQDDGQHWWSVTVDAETGELLTKQDYVVRNF